MEQVMIKVFIEVKNWNIHLFDEIIGCKRNFFTLRIMLKILDKLS